MVKSLHELSIDAFAAVVKEEIIRVLYVDDDLDFLKMMKKCLEVKGGFQVDVAKSVREAEEKLNVKNYDVIVCDCWMPEKDCLVFLRELKGKGNNVPFIIFTGKGKEEVAFKAFKLGADGYVSKAGNSESVCTELAYNMRQAVKSRRIKDELRRERDFAKNLLEASPAFFVAINVDGNVLFMNKSFLKALGYTREEVIGKNYLATFIPEKERKMLSKIFDNMIKEGKSTWNRNHVLTKDGKQLLVEWRGRPIFKTNGELDYFFGIGIDVTERKRIEEELRESEEKFRAIAMAAKDAVIVMDDEGKITFWNPSAEKMFGYTCKEALGKDLHMLIAPKEFYPFFKRGVGRFKKTGKGALIGKTVRFPAVKKDGTEFPAEFSFSAYQAKGRWYAIALTRDISERVRVEKMIKEKEKMFEQLFMSNPEAAVYVDSNFNILNVNPRFTKLFGYTLKEIYGKNIDDIVVPEDKIEEAKMLNKKTFEGYVYHDTIRKRKDGTLIPVSISAAPIKVEGKFLGFVVMYKDISQLKKIEKELKEAEKHFETLFNVMVDPVIIIDSEGKILEVTNKLEEVTGLKKKNLIGKNVMEVEVLPQKSKTLIRKNLMKRIKGIYVAPYEIEVLTKKGEKLPFEVNGAKIEYKGSPAIMIVLRDISERKLMEDKLRIVGRLIRHDVRNKLSTILGNVYLAKKKLPKNHEALENLKAIESAVQQAVRIFDFARTYERLGMEKLVYMNVEETVNEAVSLFSDMHNVKVINKCKGLRVLADSLLRQLFYNLIDNSLRYGKKISKIRIYYKEENDHLKLIYEDDGVGIPKREKEKIFMEGYGGNTGYGLYLIRKICETYGWTIKETGEYGKGAQFTIIIPKRKDGCKMCYQISKDNLL